MIADLIALTERLHHRSLGLMEASLDELDVRDINGSEAAILCAIANGVTYLRDLAAHGYPRGTNLTYRVQKLVGAGYLIRKHRGNDRRSKGLQLTEKGRRVRADLMTVQLRCIESLTEYGTSREELEDAIITLQRLERVIGSAPDLGYRRATRREPGC